MPKSGKTGLQNASIEAISVQRLSLAGRTIVLPASKSISNRALVIGAMKGGVSLHNVSDCDDTFVTQRALRERGSVIDIMAAGTAMRFLTAYFATQAGEEHTMTGTERMQHRPIALLVDALRQLGADISYEREEGFPPLHIRGRQLEGGDLSLAGNVSSQYISALLMIGPTLQKGLCLHLTGNIVSRPYIDMTLQMMRDFGAEAEWQGDDCIVVQPNGYKAQQDLQQYTIENDWSASSYWYEMVALTPGSQVTLPDLFAQSMQGDQVVKDIFRKLGVETAAPPPALPVPERELAGAMSSAGGVAEGEGRTGIVLRHTGQRVERLDIDMVRCPDLAQTVVVTCCMLQIPFRITGLQSLKIKETDRIAALRTELAKLGFEVGEENDSVLFWDGENSSSYPITGEAGVAIDTYDDHRMAMSFAPCCQTLGQIRINHPEVVSKSYPRFWEEFETLKIED